MSSRIPDRPPSLPSSGGLEAQMQEAVACGDKAPDLLSVPKQAGADAEEAAPLAQQRPSARPSGASRVLWADETENNKADHCGLVEEIISPAFGPARWPGRPDNFQMAAPREDLRATRSSAGSALRGSGRHSLRSSASLPRTRHSIRDSLRSLQSSDWGRSSQSLSAWSSRSSTQASTLFEVQDKLYRFQDLDKSWLIWVVRLLHGVYFLFAIVLIACIGINVLMNMFLEFFARTARAGRTWTMDALWGHVLSILSICLLFVHLFAGLLQRASWLLVDAVRIDMFHVYRRTLCCEGVGPGTFPKQRITVTITEEKQLRRVYSALSWDCSLEHDILVAGKRVVAGAQLLADESMEGKLCRDEVLDLEVPSVLNFSVSSRALDLYGADPTMRMWAIADMIFQWLILASLDVVPLARACNAMIGTGFFYSQWYTTLMTTGTVVACGHVVVYYLWSTVMDYKDKIVTFRRLQAQREEVRRASRHLVASSSFCMSVTSFASVAPSEVNGRRPSLGMRKAILAAYKDDTEQLLGAGAEEQNWVDQSPPGFDESLNACLCLHNFLASRKVKGVLFVIFAMGVCANILAPVRIRKFRSYLDALMVLVGVILLKVSVKLMNSGMAALGSAPLLITGDSVTLRLWAAWFRVHCGITGDNSSLKAGFFMVICLVWTLISVEGGYTVHSVVAFILFCWFSARLWFSKRSARNHLWKFALVQTIICTILVITSITYALRWRGFLFACTGALITQMGLHRQTEHKRFKFIFMVLFCGIAAVIGALTGVASAGNGGTTFSLKQFPWCESGDAHCKELLFPLHGSRKSYEFCSLAWPMGPVNSTSTLPSTVHEQCKDTSLSIVDFSEMANLAYYLPHEADVRKVIEKYLPGWRIVHMQHYNANQEKYTTFIHLSRGKTSVIAVRGTWAFIEALQDLNFWMPAAFVQMSQRLGPSMLDVKSIMRAVAYPKALGIFPVRKTQFKDLLDYTEKAIEELDPEHRQYFYITGHSLGGGLAKVVGGLLGIHAITFSSPGLQATAEMLNPRPSAQELQRSTVTVIADNDVVPMVDWQHGTLLHIDCPFAHPMECHGLGFTTCELLASCGDGGGHSIPRRYVKTCEECALSGQSVDAKNTACFDKGLRSVFV